jgi:hypothetical protein
MSEAKFSKGPWAVSQSCTGSFDVVFNVDSLPTPCRNDEYLNFTPVSHSYEGENLFKGDTAKANAHLIAAAPEMYEMLEMLNSMPTDGAKEFLESSNAVTELLAKARGEHE